MKYEKNKPFSNAIFIKILDFYLFNCPVVFDNGRIVSNNSKNFDKLKYDKKRYLKLNNSIRKSLGTCYYCLDNDESVENVYKNMKDSNNKKDDYFEFIIFKKNSELNKTQSMFYCIRNAIAHNSFTFVCKGNKYIYYFENIKNGVLSGKIRLKEDTLLYYIELVKKC